MRVCVADWAGACHELLARLGFRRTQDPPSWPIHDMSHEDMMALADELLAQNVGVMIRPPHPALKEPSYDYLLFVDSPRGKFSQR